MLDQRFLRLTVCMLSFPSEQEALSQCWPSVADGVPALNQYWLNVASLLKCNVHASSAVIVCWILLTIQ